MGGSATRLHFEDLSPVDFERLCCALLAVEGHGQIRHWGAAGSEKGCDLISVDPGGQPVVTQCKRVKALGPNEAEKELRKVLDDPPSPAPTMYSLVASCALSRRTHERLKEVAKGALPVALCDGTQLELRVRQHPDLVDWFFGSAAAAAVESPLWWVSAAPPDRAWAEAFADDLRACLQRVRPQAEVELGIPSQNTPWPEVAPRARWGLVVVTPEALAEPRLRQIWKGTLCQPCAGGGARRLLALSLTPAPWPPWLEERFERVDLGADEAAYRLDLAAIISKYIGLTEKEALGDLKAATPAPARPLCCAIWRPVWRRRIHRGGCRSSNPCR